MTQPLVHEPPRGVGIDQLEAVLLEAFGTLRDALAAGRPVIVVVHDSDLLGQGEVADAALANALVGLVRALATEGTSDGWQVNALAVSDEIGDDARRAWIGRLTDPQGATGALVRLGDLHLGRVPV